MNWWLHHLHSTLEYGGSNVVYDSKRGSNRSHAARSKDPFFDFYLIVVFINLSIILFFGWGFKVAKFSPKTIHVGVDMSRRLHTKDLPNSDDWSATAGAASGAAKVETQQLEVTPPLL